MTENDSLQTVQAPAKTWKRRILYLIFAGFLLTCGGIVLQVVNIFRNMDFGMMGGDCPESTSYGGVSITGNVKADPNNSHKEIHIVANKSKGGCPQSEAITNQELIFHNGDNILAGYSIHLGDPALKITISAAGYESCELLFSSAVPREDVDWQITLGAALIIEQKTVQYGYTLDKNGKLGLVTSEPFGSPSYHQVCPKVS